MIGHQARADHWQRVPGTGHIHQADEFVVVGAIMKSLRAIVATIDDVVTQAGNDGSRGSRHAACYPRRA